MKLYELAALKGYESSIQFLEFLKKNKIVIRNHMVELTNEQLEEIEKLFQKMAVKAENMKKQKEIVDTKNSYKKSTQNCDKCNSRRIAYIYGYSGENYEYKIKHLKVNIDSPCYPSGLPFFDNKLEFSVCLDCGKMQGVFPITDAVIKELLGED